MYGYYRDIFRGRELPFAFVDLDLFDENLQAIAARAGAKTIRLASKSIRSAALLGRILRSGPPFRGVLCYSAREAIFLSGQGFDDLVVAYPVVHRALLDAVCREIQKGRTIVLMVDSRDHVERLSAAAREHGVVLPVAIDLDVSYDLPGFRFGVFRSPVATAADAVALRDTIHHARHLRLDGLMAYEAQIAGLPDEVLVRLLKKHSAGHVARRRADVVRALGELRFVNGGGTGSLETTREEAAVTELTVGSGFYSPGLFDGYRAFRHKPAAAFAVEIVRRPSPHVYTCHGGGYVASGAPSRHKLPRPYLPDGAKLLWSEGAGEVQTPVFYRGEESLALGDPIFFRHAKAGELCEHFNTLALVSKGRLVDEARTYRGEGRSFL